MKQTLYEPEAEPGPSLPWLIGRIALEAIGGALLIVGVPAGLVLVLVALGVSP